MNKPILKDSMKLFEPLGKIKSHSMFGGFGIFADETMFSMVVNGQLHIRADKDTIKQYERQGFQPYVYKKRGLPVITKYFAVPEDLWQDQKQILQLASKSLDFAKEEKAEQAAAKPTRLKDLPNLRITNERMLKKAGIDSVERLSEFGSLNAFNAIKETYASAVSTELLLALEGAINGTHWSVIQDKRRKELINQVN